MLRRSFRFGLKTGLLLGVAIAVAKMLQGRRDADPLPATPLGGNWPPLPDTPSHADATPRVVPPTQATPTPAPAPAPPPDSGPAAPAPPAEPAASVPPPAPAAAASAAKKATKAAKQTRKTSRKRAHKAAAKPAPAWIEAEGGTCPTTHPVKAKMTSKIFHLPGMLNYERTKADRCYVDQAGAEADGLRASKI